MSYYGYPSGNGNSHGSRNRSNNHWPSDDMYMERQRSDPKTVYVVYRPRSPAAQEPTNSHLQPDYPQQGYSQQLSYHGSQNGSVHHGSQAGGSQHTAVAPAQPAQPPATEQPPEEEPREEAQQYTEVQLSPGNYTSYGAGVRAGIIQPSTPAPQYYAPPLAPAPPAAAAPTSMPAPADYNADLQAHGSRALIGQAYGYYGEPLPSGRRYFPTGNNGGQGSQGGYYPGYGY